MPNPIVKTLTIGGVTYNLKDVDADSFAPKASPALTGIPTAPTAAIGTDTTQIANTAFVQDTIEDKTDLVISVGEIGTAIAGQSVIGTDSTNFPTSKAVVTYIENRLGEAAERSVDENIPVAAVGETVVGDPVGTISRNLPTSKAVVEYIEGRLEEEMSDVVTVKIVRW